jgi:hypothetical protein
MAQPSQKSLQMSPSLPHVYAVSRRLRKTWTIIRVRDYVAVSDAFAFLDRGEVIPAELGAALSERYAKIRVTLSRGEQTTP